MAFHADQQVQLLTNDPELSSPSRPKQGCAIMTAKPMSAQAEPVSYNSTWQAPVQKPSLIDRIEAIAMRLSTRSAFWYKMCSLVYLPYAFRSGIAIKPMDQDGFKASLPFRRFNRNWYNMMAGAALLGNAEIAGGSYLFRVCGSDYAVVCKDLSYKFLRPCEGPAEYRVTANEDLHALAAQNQEFNITLEMEIVQTSSRRRAKGKLLTGKPWQRQPGRERRVGRASATFHLTPRRQFKAKNRRPSGSA